MNRRQSPNNIGKIPELDALRGLAALGVILYHAYPAVFFLGWTGVDLFFVLSGFLISHIILEHIYDRGFFLVFYLRRAIRIWPVYYFTLVVVLALNALSAHGYSTAGLPYHLFFIQNVQHYWRASAPAFIHPFAPSWSVAIEEQFYLLWPAIIWGLGRRRVLRVACCLIAVSIGARALGLPYDVLAGRFDGLAMGSILAVLLRNVREQPQFAAVKITPYLLVAAALSSGATCVLALKFWADPYPRWAPITFTVFSVLYASLVGLVVLHSGSSPFWLLRTRVLRWLGSISYALYMFHLPILTYGPALLTRAGVRSYWLSALLQWFAIFALPTISSWCLEKPALSLKHRFEYERGAAKHPAATS